MHLKRYIVAIFFLFIVLQITMVKAQYQCYQETPMIGTACGGLFNGTFNLTWAGSSASYGYINYTEPQNVTSAMIQLRMGNGTLPASNITVPAACMEDKSDNILEFRYYGQYGPPSGFTFECKNNTGLFSKINVTDYVTSKVTQEVALVGAYLRFYDGIWNDESPACIGDGAGSTATVGFNCDATKSNLSYFYEEGIYWNISTSGVFFSYYNLTNNSVPNSTSTSVYTGTVSESLNSNVINTLGSPTAVDVTCLSNLSNGGDSTGCWNTGGSTSLDAYFLWKGNLSNLNQFPNSDSEDLIYNITVWSTAAKITNAIENITLAMRNMSNMTGTQYIILNRSINPTLGANVTLTFTFSDRGNASQFLDQFSRFEVLSLTQGGNNVDMSQEYFGINVTYQNKVFNKTQDSIYPIFYNYTDNNGTFVGSATAMFNVSINNSNGTVFLQVNNQNFTASNVTYNYFNITTTLTTGVYPYQWITWGNGSNTNLNVSGLRYYTVNASDTCSYTSGNFIINCANNCVFSSNIDLLGYNNFTASGSGTVSGLRFIKNYKQGLVNGGCLAKA